METNNLSIGIGGVAGAGIMESGAILAKISLRMGLYPFVHSEYPSLIKGGHNFSNVRIHSKPIASSRDDLDLLIALDQNTLEFHKANLHSGSAVIYDNNLKLPQEQMLSDVLYYAVPIDAIVEEIQAPPIVRNTAALGAALSVVGVPLEKFSEILTEEFASKGDILATDLKAAKLGYFSVPKDPNKIFNYNLAPQENAKDTLLMNGNDAISLGALRAGVQFAAIYPMTPATSILEFLAKYEAEYNLVIKEPEDEISAINISLGASYAGARSMTATSGGGFALMTEAMSLAGMAEIPLVVVEAMRGGPSTGLPTKTEQSDLRFLLHCGHGDFPKVVVAPGDPVECYQETFRAFNIAEMYQLPVIIVTDKYLSSSTHTIEIPVSDSWPITRGEVVKEADGKFPRYKDTDTGVSPRAFPGSKGTIHKASSDEHDEFGFVTEDPAVRNIMMRKRMKKLDSLAADLPEPVLYGATQAQITIFGWGSTKGPIVEAIEILQAQGIAANFLHLLYIQPFPSYSVSTAFDQAPQTLIVENNFTSQLGGLIREKTGRNIKNKLLRYDGFPFTAEEIVSKVKEIAGLSTATASPVVTTQSSTIKILDTTIPSGG